MISVKENLAVKQIQTHTKIQTSCSNCPAKSLVLQRKHLLVVIAIVIFGKNGKIVVLFSWKRWSDQHKTNCFPAKYAQKIAMKSAVFYSSFSAKFALRISVNFLWNQLFFCEFDSETPMKFDFFSWPIRSPVKSLSSPTSSPWVWSFFALQTWKVLLFDWQSLLQRVFWFWRFHNNENSHCGNIRIQTF